MELEVKNNRKTKRLSVTIRMTREDIVDYLYDLMGFAEDQDLIQEFLDYCYNKGYLKKEKCHGYHNLSPFFHKWDDETLAGAYMQLHEAVTVSNRNYWLLGANHSGELLF